VNYIIGFPQRYPKSKIYRIETNYRSTPEVLALANDSIQHNHAQFEKNLKACRQSGMKPALVALRNPSDQASFVAQRIHELVEENGFAYSDIAVLYRAHFQSMEVQLEFTTQQIPFQITSGLRFFEQAHIKDFTAFLRLAVNPQDEAAFDRLVQLLDGVGGVSAQKLWQQWKACDFVRRRTLRAHVSETLLGFKLPPKAKEDWEQMAYTMDEFVTKEGELVGPVVMMKSVWEGIYSAYLKASFENAEQRQQDIEQFRRFAERFETVEHLLTELSLLSGPESAASASDKERDSVTLSSIHQAKGLEWKVVFVIWLAASMFPNPRAVDEGGSEALEEERRLFYVAATRAMDQLYLTYPHFWQRAYDGDPWQMPSLFLSEIDSSRVEEWRVGV
jgi:DNA helicase-2/ATP-dependent DNA helicase PcrA